MAFPPLVPRTVRWPDVFPGRPAPGVSPNRGSTTIAASSPGLMGVGQPSAVHALVAIIILLVVIRIVYEMAPVRGKKGI